MTLNGLNITLGERKFYGAHQKKIKLNKNRPILSGTKCRLLILVSRNTVWNGICCLLAGFLGEGPSNDSGVVEDGNLHRFNWCLLGNFRQDIGLYTVGHKRCHFCFYDNFDKCGPMSIILSLLDS